MNPINKNNNIYYENNYRKREADFEESSLSKKSKIENSNAFNFSIIPNNALTDNILSRLSVKEILNFERSAKSHQALTKQTWINLTYQNNYHLTFLDCRTIEHKEKWSFILNSFLIKYINYLEKFALHFEEGYFYICPETLKRIYGKFSELLEKFSYLKECMDKQFKPVFAFNTEKINRIYKESIVNKKSAESVFIALIEMTNQTPNIAEQFNKILQACSRIIEKDFTIATPLAIRLLKNIDKINEFQRYPDLINLAVQSAEKKDFRGLKILLNEYYKDKLEHIINYISKNECSQPVRIFILSNLAENINVRTHQKNWCYDELFKCYKNRFLVPTKTLENAVIIKHKFGKISEAEELFDQVLIKYAKENKEAPAYLLEEFIAQEMFKHENTEDAEEMFSQALVKYANKGKEVSAKTLENIAVVKYLNIKETEAKEFFSQALVKYAEENRQAPTNILEELVLLTDLWNEVDINGIELCSKILTEYAKEDKEVPTKTLESIAEIYSTYREDSEEEEADKLKAEEIYHLILARYAKKGEELSTIVLNQIIAVKFWLEKWTELEHFCYRALAEHLKKDVAPQFYLLNTLLTAQSKLDKWQVVKANFTQLLDKYIENLNSIELYNLREIVYIFSDLKDNLENQEEIDKILCKILDILEALFELQIKEKKCLNWNFEEGLSKFLVRYNKYCNDYDIPARLLTIVAHVKIQESKYTEAEELYNHMLEEYIEGENELSLETLKDAEKLYNQIIAEKSIQEVLIETLRNFIIIKYELGKWQEVENLFPQVIARYTEDEEEIPIDILEDAIKIKYEFKKWDELKEIFSLAQTRYAEEGEEAPKKILEFFNQANKISKWQEKEKNFSRIITQYSKYQKAIPIDILENAIKIKYKLEKWGDVEELFSVAQSRYAEENKEIPVKILEFVSQAKDEMEKLALSWVI